MKNFKYQVQSDSGKWLYKNYADALDFAEFLDRKQGQDCEILELNTQKIVWASYKYDCPDPWTTW